jgi:hypothetical protein
MTMPHLMNCPHSETGWCGDCVKQQWEELYESRIDAGKYERCLDAAAQRLNEVYELRDVKVVGLLEVPTVIEHLISDRNSLLAALKSARLGAKLRGVTTREFAAMCAITPTQLSRWTADWPDCEPDIICRRGS